MTYKELRISMMKLKKTDPEKSKIFMLLLDTIQKIAKADKNREENDNDIILAAKRMLKQADQSKTAGMDVDKEMEILSEFLPKNLNKEETEQLIIKIIGQINDRSMKLIMQELKQYKNVDMKMASEIIRNNK